MVKGKKLSRRDFARTSMAAGAAAAALPGVLLGKEAVAGPIGGKAAGVAAAKRRRVTLPPEVAYGGLTPDGSDAQLSATLTPAGQTAPSYPGGWQEGLTMPAEYYVDEKHFATDEAFIKDHLWLMADHETRIPNAGDYFVFEFGRGDSVIIVRDRAGAVQAYHNVCRHRGSRLCMHGTEFDNVRPSETLADGKPADPRMSTVQLGSSGNSPVFRCVYHAWTYDLDGKLVSFPAGMPSGFDAAEHGLHPCHVRTVEGFIYVNFSLGEPPDFDGFVANWQRLCEEYGTKDLKVVARKSYPTKANWKLALENFRECYHCVHSHGGSFVRSHAMFIPGIAGPEQLVRVAAGMAEHGHPLGRGDDYFRVYQPTEEPGAGGMGRGRRGTHLPEGSVTGSLDGKAVAPLLPKRTEWTHRRRSATTGFSTSFISVYDDHVAVARFTPRNVMGTDVEIFWMVHPDAKESEYDVDRMMAVWDLTYREDRWITENNHHGIMNSRYNLMGGQPYAASEGGPAGLVKWYMTEVAPAASAKSTDAA